MIQKVLTNLCWRPARALTHWLHTRWPAGTVEALPVVQADCSTNIPGLFVVGDLRGTSLLKLSADDGARTVQRIVADPHFHKQRALSDPDICDLIIVGAGVSGMAAALEADKAGLRYELIESTQAFSTIRNFPRGKPIYAYPTQMEPAGSLRFTGESKETLLAELRSQTVERGIQPTRYACVESIGSDRGVLQAVLRDAAPLHARRIVVAIGRTGNYRTLKVDGEDLPKVGNRLFDPSDYRGRRVLIVGGGDSAVEAAVAIAERGGSVDLTHRGAELSRPKPANLARLARQLATSRDADPAHQGIRLHLNSRVTRIEEHTVTIATAQGSEQLANDAVLTLIGREAPLDFFRRSGVRIRGETRGLEWAGLGVFLLMVWLIYDWKNHGLIDQLPLVQGEPVQSLFQSWLNTWASWWDLQLADRSTWLGTLAVSMTKRSFYYTLLYTVCIGWFGLRRVLRRRTPYVTVQTSVLFLVQLFPLFLLPELILPWMGYNGAFDSGWGLQFADGLFESHISPAQWAAGQWPEASHPRAYWRAYGFILAFPLLIYNVLTEVPMGGWLWISFLQSFVILPLLVWKWGKGAFCGWICSCGGLAETMGDAHRHKMFHGETANRFNMAGQVILLLAFVLLGLRIWGWVFPGGVIDAHFWRLVDPASWFSYLWLIDVGAGGVLGVGLYFKYSGRIWCRFACPLAALMHFYARFSRFRILAVKSRCISCNACTSDCHMGVDVMSFANKGAPMEDPECVRCSACVAACPTGALDFGEVDRHGNTQRHSWLRATPTTGEQPASAPDS